jgi:predicted AlkP superfamily pyrophosphatase or phosphodiesterase
MKHFISIEGEAKESQMNKNLCVLIIIIMVFPFLVTDCQNSTNGNDNVYNYKILPVDRKFENKHVFLIGLDGWGGYSFKNSSFEMPTIETIIPVSSYTFEAINVMPSITIPNWASMFMGTSPDVHGYKTNPAAGNDEPSAASTFVDKYGIFPSIFTLLKEERPNCKVAFFFEKPKIGYLCPDNVIDIKRNIINLSGNDIGISNITDCIESEKPNFTAIIFLEPDGVGHAVGHNTQKYYNQLTKMDDYIEKIITSIKKANIWDDSILFFSSDHGGIGNGHGGDTPLEREIPLIICGKNIRSNYKITEPVMIYDIAATIAYIFELGTPFFWTGNVLNVFSE